MVRRQHFWDLSRLVGESKRLLGKRYTDGLSSLWGQVAGKVPRRSCGDIPRHGRAEAGLATALNSCALRGRGWPVLSPKPQPGRAKWAGPGARHATCPGPRRACPCRACLPARCGLARWVTGRGRCQAQNKARDERRVRPVRVAAQRRRTRRRRRRRRSSVTCCSLLSNRGCLDCSPSPPPLRRSRARHGAAAVTSTVSARLCSAQLRARIRTGCTRTSV